MPNNEPVTVDSLSIRPLINENESQIIFQRHCNYDRINGGLLADSVEHQYSIATFFVNELKEIMDQKQAMILDAFNAAEASYKEKLKTITLKMAMVERKKDS